MAYADRGINHFAWSRKRSAIVMTGRWTEAWGLNMPFSAPVTKPPASVSLRTTACFRTETFKTLDFL